MGFLYRARVPGTARLDARVRRSRRSSRIELFFDDMTAGNWRKLTAPLKEEVKKRGLWACHLDPELGGQGYGQVKLALMHEILGRSGPAPNIFGNQAPDSGNSELIAIGATPEQREKWLEPLLRGEMTSSFSMTEPHYLGQRSDDDQDASPCATATST